MDKHTHTLPPFFSHSPWPVKFPWFCLQWVLIEQVVSEGDKLRRDPAENGSGSQTEREQGCNLGISPICRSLAAPHTLMNTIYEQTVAFIHVNYVNPGKTQMKYSVWPSTAFISDGISEYINYINCIHLHRYMTSNVLGKGMIIIQCVNSEMVFTSFIPSVHPGVVRTGHCGASSAIDRDVLWRRQLTEGAGQSEEGTCLWSVRQHWRTEGEKNVKT